MLDTLVTPWAVSHKVPLSLGFPRQEYWNGLPFPSPGDFLDSGIDLMVPALAGIFFATKPLEKPKYWHHTTKKKTNMFLIFHNIKYSREVRYKKKLMTVECGLPWWLRQ